MDLDMLVAGADPARHADLPGPDSAEAARLYRQITAPAPRRRWTRPPVPAVAAGLVAAATAVTLLLVNFAGSPRPGSTGPGGAIRGNTGPGSVAAILDAAAVAAGHGAGASHPPGPGQYLYVEEIEARGLSNKPTQACPEAPMTSRAWVAADGSGRQIGTFPSRCAAGDFDLSYTKGGLPWDLYGVVQAGTFPTRPKALERAIVRRFEHGHSRPSATFVYAATFLNAGSTAALRAALYRVIESLPGVQNLGWAADRLGRRGQAVGLVTAGTREELIFDPASTVVLERELVAVPPEQSGNDMLPPGTVEQYTVYVREGVVNSDTATPGPVTHSATHGPATPAPRVGTASPSPGAGTASPSPSPGAGTPTPPSAATPSSAGIS
jgi:hypothetical protein